MWTPLLSYIYHELIDARWERGGGGGGKFGMSSVGASNGANEDLLYIQTLTSISSLVYLTWIPHSFIRNVNISLIYICYEHNDKDLKTYFIHMCAYIFAHSATRSNILQHTATRVHRFVRQRWAKKHMGHTMNESSSRTLMSLVTNVYESCRLQIRHDTYEWVTEHIWIRHVCNKCEWDTSH